MKEDFVCPHCKKDNYYNGDILGDEQTTRTNCEHCEREVILEGHIAHWITADKVEPIKQETITPPEPQVVDMAPVRVRFLKDVPGYHGAENEFYPSRKTGEEATMPRVEVDWLVKGKLAEIVD